MTAALSARFSELPLRLYVSWGVSLADVRTFVNEGGSTKELAKRPDVESSAMELVRMLGQPVIHDSLVKTRFEEVPAI